MTMSATADYYSATKSRYLLRELHTELPDHGGSRTAAHQEHAVAVDFERLFDLLELTDDVSRVVHGVGVVARQRLEPSTMICDPLASFVRSDRGGRAGHDIDCHGGYFSLRDDDPAGRRHAFFYYINEAPTHRALVMEAEADAAMTREAAQRWRTRAAAARAQASVLRDGGEPNIAWRAMGHSASARRQLHVRVLRAIYPGDELFAVYDEDAPTRIARAARRKLAPAPPAPAWARHVDGSAVVALAKYLEDSCGGRGDVVRGALFGWFVGDVCFVLLMLSLTMWNSSGAGGRRHEATATATRLRSSRL